MVTGLRDHSRYDYLPIVCRPDYSWLKKRRLAVYLDVNHEVFAFDGGMGAALAPAKTDRDVRNSAWRDYDNRVDAWRFMEIFNRLELTTTARINRAITTRCQSQKTIETVANEHRTG